MESSKTYLGNKIVVHDEESKTLVEGAVGRTEGQIDVTEVRQLPYSETYLLTLLDRAPWRYLVLQMTLTVNLAQRPMSTGLMVSTMENVCGTM